MQRQRYLPACVTRFTLRAALLAAVLVLGLTHGCATTRAVKEIVAESNARLEALALANDLAASSSAPVPGLPGSQLAAEVLTAIERIDDFISTHPDMGPTLDALRVRKAMLLLNSGQLALARSAFGEVESPPLSARDRALWRNADALVEWWRLAPLTSTPSRERIDGVVEAFAAEVALPEPSPMQAWFETSLALARFKRLEWFGEGDGVAAELRSALDAYLAGFGPADRAGIRELHATEPDFEQLKAIPPTSLRRYGYVEPVFTAYVTAAGALGVPASPTFDDWVR